MNINSFSSLVCCQSIPTPSIESNGSLKPFPLYSDVLQIVMKYLRTNELISSIQLSKQWYQTLQTAPSFGVTSLVSAVHLASIPVNSAIARHVAVAANLNVAIRNSEDQASSNVSLLASLGNLLPNLTAGFQIITNPSVEVKSYSLPTQLKGITLILNSPSPVLFESVSTLSHLRELQLGLDFDDQQTRYDWSPLSKLQQLELLWISAWFETEDELDGMNFFSLTQFIRQTRIRSLIFSTSDRDTNIAWRKILQPTPQEPTFPLLSSGNLSFVDLKQATLDGELLKILSNYPSLTRLVPKIFDISNIPNSDLSLFAKFHNLTQIKFLPKPDVGPFSGDLMATTSQYLRNLRSIRIEQWNFNCQHMDACLANLPYLTELALSGTQQFETLNLAPLIKYNLPTRLTRLVLIDLSISVGDLRNYILPLQMLTYLEMFFYVNQDAQSPPESSSNSSSQEMVPDDLMKQLRAMPNLKDFIVIPCKR